MTRGQDPFSQLLYPMLSEQPSVDAAVVAELARAPLEKSAESNALRRRLVEESAERDRGVRAGHLVARSPPVAACSPAATAAARRRLPTWSPSCSIPVRARRSPRSASPPTSPW